MSREYQGGEISRFRLADPALVAKREETLQMLAKARRRARTVKYQGRRYKLLRLPDGYGDMS